MKARLKRWLDYGMPLVLCVCSIAFGYFYRELQHRMEHSQASNLCFSKGHIDAYLSRLDDGEFVCFREDINRKKITKSALVLE